MIFKVFYQEEWEVPPMRERTESLFIEADSVRDVRSKLAGRNYNIEYIQETDEAFLEYEKQSDQFEVER
ncbi:MAG TPA: RNA polymerase epsilon subunit [Bacillales bacterium]|nr:RNA polymerase epsilon subunit [Bacillales bacterium]